MHKVYAGRFFQYRLQQYSFARSRTYGKLATNIVTQSLGKRRRQIHCIRHPMPEGIIGERQRDLKTAFRLRQSSPPRNNCACAAVREKPFLRKGLCVLASSASRYGARPSFSPSPTAFCQYGRRAFASFGITRRRNRECSPPELVSCGIFQYRVFPTKSRAENSNKWMMIERAQLKRVASIA